MFPRRPGGLGQGVSRFFLWYGMVDMVWYDMVEVCEGTPVAVGGWVLTDRHDLAPCAANSLHRTTIIGGIQTSRPTILNVQP